MSTVIGHMTETIVNRLRLTLIATGFRLLGLVIPLFTVSVTGCTSMQPVTMGSGTLQENMRNGSAVHEGEKVRVVTLDGVSHQLKVIAVEGDVLRGYPEGTRSVVNEIPIDDILALEKENVSAGDTAVSAFGTTTIVLAFAFLIAVMFG